MGDLTKTLFGGSETQDELAVTPRLPAVDPGIRTGEGSLLRTALDISDTGALRGVDITSGVSPQVRALREEVLGGTRGLIGDVFGDIQTLRGAANPFIRARVNPFIEQQEAARRAATRRGVGGPLSALATNPFTQQIADQGALATFETQQAIQGGQELIRGLLSDVSGQGRQLLEQELALLGLSQQQIRDIVESQLQQTTNVLRESETQQGIVPSLGRLAGGIGGVLDFFG